MELRGSQRQGKRREVWVWTAVIEEPDGRWWVDFEAGGQSEATFLRLYARLPEAELYRSDHYAVQEWLPPDRHMVGKGGSVNWNEGRHSRLWDQLKRLQRKARGYSKSVAILQGAVALVCFLKLGLI